MLIIKILAVLALLWAVYALLPTCWLKHFRKTQKTGSLSGSRLLLTFDDGPHPLYTSRLLDLLAEQNVKATFFLLAENAARYPALVGRMQEEGHSVALHGLRHGNMWLMAPRRTRESLQQGLALLQAQGVKPRYYRPPYGNVNLCTLYYAHKLGLKLWLWDVMVGDWRADANAQELAQRLENSLTKSAVICLHDNGAGRAAPGAPLRTIEALRSFIPLSLAQGYEYHLPTGGAA